MATRLAASRRALSSVLVAALIAAPLSLAPVSAAFADEETTAVVVEEPVAPVVDEPADPEVTAPVDEPAAPVEEPADPEVTAPTPTVTPTKPAPAKSDRAAARAIDQAPSAVNNVAATRVDSGTILVTWSAPSDWGTSAVGYGIEIAPTGSNTWTYGNPGGGFGGTGANVTSYYVTEGVTASQRFQVRMYAYNTSNVGNGPYTTVTESFAAPSAPTNLAATPAATSLALTWNAPATSLGDLTYAVQYKLASASAWSASIAASGTSTTLTGLVTGSAYDVRVMAVTPGDTGPWSTTLRATPVAPVVLATAPRIFERVVRGGSAYFDWDAPASLGSGAFSHYILQYTLDGAPEWTTIGTFAEGGTSGFGWSGLISWRVAAVTSAGTGEFAYLYDISTLGSAAATPSNVQATTGVGTLVVTWDAPPVDPNVAVTGYSVRFRTVGSTTWNTVPSATTSITLFSLQGGSTYEVQVATTAAGGNSAFSASASVMVVDVPAQVVTVQVVPGDRSAAISWTAPAARGSAITGYEIDFSGSVTYRSVASGTSLNLAGLTNGVSRTVRVRAINAIGTGAYSPIRSFIPYSVPLATTLAAVRGNEQVSLSWPAADAQGSAVTSYQVRYVSGDTTWTVNVGTNTNPVIRGLTNDTAYTFSVRAANAAGNGPWSNEVTAIPVVPVLPSVPQNFTSSHAGTSGSFSWSAPATPGTEPITSYRLEYRPQGEAAWNVAASGIRFSYTLGSWVGLYDFRLSAVSAAGTSPYATITGLSSAGFRAAAPAGLTLFNDNAAFIATWTAPASDARTPAVTRYHLEYRAVGASSWTWGPYVTRPASTIDGLVNGTTYEVRVQGESPAGVTPYSSVSTITVGQPAQIFDIAAERGDRSARVTWLAPELYGSTLIGYDVQVLDAGTWASVGRVTTSESTVTDLENGTAYGVRVRAVTSAGAGDWSSSVSVTPAAAPDAPIVTAERGDLEASVNWAAPASNGAAISGYELRYRSSGAWSTPVSTALTTRVVDGLTNGTAYEFQVRAINTVAPGEWSQSATVTPAGLPAAPVVSAERGDTEVDLEWTAPNSNGADITGYEVQFGIDGVWTDADDVTGTSTVVDDLTNGTAYDFRVRAVNDVDAGAWSTVATATPAGAPTDVREFEWTPISDGVTLDWAAPLDDNGADITGYDVEYRTAGGTWVRVATTAPSATITGLGNNVAYDVRIRAVNGAVDAAFLDLGSVTAGTTPSAPVDVAVAPGDAKLDVSWAAPTFTGGSAVVRYEVEYVASGSGAAASTLTVTGTSATLSGLTNSTEYDVRVRAVNTTTEGAWSDVTSIYAFTFEATFTTLSGAALTTVTPGDTVLVSGSGSLPGAGVAVELHSTPIALGSTMVAADGSFRLVVTIPANAPAGAHTLYAALGMGGGLISTSQLAITVAAVDVAADGSLVVTGVDLQLALWIAFALLAAGVLLVLASRRRRAQR